MELKIETLKDLQDAFERYKNLYGDWIRARDNKTKCFGADADELFALMKKFQTAIINNKFAIDYICNNDDLRKKVFLQLEQGLRCYLGSLVGV